MWAAPCALWGFLHVRVQADHVVSSGASVTEDDLSSLLTNLAIVLVIGLIAIGIFIH